MSDCCVGAFTFFYDLALGNTGNDVVLAALLPAADRLLAAFEDPATGMAVIE